jgi:putative CocE/NonD family hydrolase
LPSSTVVIEKNMAIPMGDGCVLRADVYRSGDPAPSPVLLQRTPYDKERAISLDIAEYVRAGYAVVVQDVRGRFASEGTFEPFTTEGPDGRETIAWLTAQPWSSGAIGMFGQSYVGATQWLAAVDAPPSLRAIAPGFTSSSWHQGWLYQGGAFQLGFALLWSMLNLALPELTRRVARGSASPDEVAELIDRVDRIDGLYGNAEPPASLAPYYRTWLDHPSYDDYWRSTAPREHYDRVSVPSLNIGGWYDLFLAGTLENYSGMRARGATESARRARLIIGPWAHGAATGEFAELRFGLRAGTVGADVVGEHLRWFDQELGGVPAGGDPVRVFVMGSNRWRSAQSWPLPETSYDRYHLHSRGSANSSGGDGVLAPEPPGSEPDDVYTHNPHDPVPTTGGNTFLPGLMLAANAGPRDQSPVEHRSDVLCYTTAVLERPLEVVGPLTLVLYAASSAVDTDFTGKLVDVHPDGRAFNVAEGILRARYRESLSEPKALVPGSVERLELDLVATANLFDVGHRIRLEISSSNFPRFDLNMRRAVNRVFHDHARPSHLVLPVLSGESRAVPR